MAIIISTSVLGGIVLFAWGLFRSMWDNYRDKIVGTLLLAMSMVSFGLGGWGLSTILR